jgi:hypothetical protein
MNKFNYEEKNGFYLTACPCFSKEKDIRIGSSFCETKCLYFKSHDKENKIIYCNGKRIIEDKYTKEEEIIAKIISKWIVYYGNNGLNPKLVVPDSIICFNIIKDIEDHLIFNIKEK